VFGFHREHVRGVDERTGGRFDEQTDRATDEVRELLAELDEALSGYLPEQRHALSVDQLFEDNVRFFAARLDGVPVGCVADLDAAHLPGDAGRDVVADAVAELRRRKARDDREDDYEDEPTPLQLKLERRFRGGLGYLLAYTLAKSQDTRSFDPAFTVVRNFNIQGR